MSKCKDYEEKFDRLTRRYESVHVDREILDNRLKSAVPRIIDMIDGLLFLVESIGDESERRRAGAARYALRTAGAFRGRGGADG